MDCVAEVDERVLLAGTYPGRASIDLSADSQLIETTGAENVSGSHERPWRSLQLD
jgi:hypothetical protein